MSWAMDLARRKLGQRLVLSMWLVTTLMFVRATGMPTEEVALSVNRRLNGHDILVFNNSTEHIICYSDTYLVDERRCVDNQYLLNVCRFTIPSYTIVLSTNDQSGMVVMYEPQCCSQPVTVNNTLCNISSLEVYRGREQAIEISHEGFSLTENGVFKINESSLAYPVAEFDGELYRMNLSCSSRGLPESGCLFFKVRGETNLTKAKFGDRVPGTVQTTTTTTLPSVVQPTTDQEILNFTDHKVFSDQKSSVSDTLLTTTLALSFSGTSGPTTDLIVYIIIAATGVVALLIVVVLLCMVLIYCIKTSKPNNITTNNKKDQSGARQLEQSLTNEASAPPLTNLWCEQSDMMSIIPINFPMRQTVPVLTDNNPVYAEVDFIEEESPEFSIPPSNYHSNPAYIHFRRCS